MSESRPDPRGLVLAATACAAVVLASQLAGKAARDAIFLQQFAVTNLPLFLAVSSALAIGTTFLFARKLSRGVPVRVVQATNLASVIALVLEWLLLDHFPRPVATVIFMHQTLLGPILVSGFWSVVSESFDPRTARRVLGTIGTGATVGAVIGAVIAERVAAMAGTAALLPAIACLQLVATWRLSSIGRGEQRQHEIEHPAIGDVVHNITRVSLLRRLATITVIVTVSAAFLDYLFKAAVSQSVTRPDDLARVFATFHGVVGVLTAIVQWLLGRWALQTFGLARTLATLPGGVIVFGMIAMLFPGVGTFVALRGAENVLRNSLFRESYEVLYTPLLAGERRATKTVIDVGVERFGDVLGGLAVLTILLLGQAAPAVLLTGAIALSAIGVLVALQAQRSYVEALERSLLARAIHLDEAHDRTTRTTMEMLASRSGDHADRPPPPPGRWPFHRSRTRAAEGPSRDASLRQLAGLASDDPARIRAALAGPPLSAAAVAQTLPLLARPDVADAARAALAAAARSCTGQLVDALRDPRLPVLVRRELPSLIAHAGDELARSGLMVSLADPDFEIRFCVAEALADLRERRPEITLDHTVVFAGVRRELAVDPAIWQAFNTATIEAAATADRVSVQGGPPSLSRAVQHLATLLALALPAEPVRTAFHGLWSDDPTLRGVALEYLDNVLPDDIRDKMWRVLSIEVPAAGGEKRPIEAVLDELLRSRRARTDEGTPAHPVDVAKLAAGRD